MVESKHVGAQRCAAAAPGAAASSPMRFATTRGAGCCLVAVGWGEDHASQVWDNGPGIPQDKQEAIFDEFSRLDAPHRQGAGAGSETLKRPRHLAGARSSAHLQSWPGKGSVFAVTLNLATRPVTAHQLAAPVVRDSQLEGVAVLCIDNERDILTAMSTLLGRWGCEVRFLRRRSGRSRGAGGTGVCAGAETGAL